MKRHGHYRGDKPSPELLAWRNARDRCHKQSDDQFDDYSGRGISMCARWRFGEDGKSGFECFLLDVGLKPAPRLTLERIDNNKGYEPGNCRWATQKEQARNRRSNRVIRFFGEEMTLVELAEWAGMDDLTLGRRLTAGQSLGRALSTRLAIVT